MPLATGGSIGVGSKGNETWQASSVYSSLENCTTEVSVTAAADDKILTKVGLL